MARKPRLYTDSQIYHIILRGNNQQNLFYDDMDRSFLISRISKYSKELNIDIYGYCLMDNHIHILLGNANKYLSLFVQKLANSYVFYFNRKYERSGHLFQGRFKSEPVDNDVYFKTVLRYILQNPEKGMNKDFTNYSWSSYKEICKSKYPKITNTSYIFDLFGSQSETIAFISLSEKHKCMEYENKIIISDNKALKLIKEVFNIKTSYTFLHLDLDEQKKKIKLLKEKGISIHQLSRLTGISKKIIKIA